MIIGYDPSWVPGDDDPPYDVQDIAQELSEKPFFEEGRAEVSKGDCEKAIDAAYPGMCDCGSQKIYREWVEWMLQYVQNSLNDFKESAA